MVLSSLVNREPMYLLMFRCNVSKRCNVTISQFIFSEIRDSFLFTCIEARYRNCVM